MDIGEGGEGGVDPMGHGTRVAMLAFIELLVLIPCLPLKELLKQ